MFPIMIKGGPEDSLSSFRAPLSVQTNLTSFLRGILLGVFLYSCFRGFEILDRIKSSFLAFKADRILLTITDNLKVATRIVGLFLAR